MENRNKSIENLFRLSQSLHPEQGAYIHLCQALRGTETIRSKITRLFTKLMPIEEYTKSEKKELIDYLVLQSNKTSIEK